VSHDEHVHCSTAAALERGGYTSRARLCMDRIDAELFSHVRSEVLYVRYDVAPVGVIGSTDRSRREAVKYNSLMCVLRYVCHDVAPVDRQTEMERRLASCAHFPRRQSCSDVTYKC